MIYSNIKFAARHKETGEFLRISYNFGLEYSWGWLTPDPDFENISLYSARNIFEEDLCFVSRQSPELKLDKVEIIQVEIQYKIN